MYDKQWRMESSRSSKEGAQCKYDDGCLVRQSRNPMKAGEVAAQPVGCRLSTELVPGDAVLKPLTNTERGDDCNNNGCTQGKISVSN